MDHYTELFNLYNSHTLNKHLATVINLLMLIWYLLPCCFKESAYVYRVLDVQVRLFKLFEDFSKDSQVPSRPINLLFFWGRFVYIYNVDRYVSAFLFVIGS